MIACEGHQVGTYIGAIILIAREIVGALPVMLVQDM